MVLVTCWYIVTCCGTSFKNCNFVHGLMRTYIWMDREEEGSASRVQQNACILRLSKGVKLIDPQVQTQALLAKIVVRGLSLGNEPQEILLKHKIHTSQLLSDSKWHDSPNWLFYNKGLGKTTIPYLQIPTSKRLL